MPALVPLASAVLLLLSAATSLCSGFDLGPIVRIAQCRSQCLKAHSLDGSCEWWRHGETACSEVGVSSLSISLYLFLSFAWTSSVLGPSVRTPGWPYLATGVLLFSRTSIARLDA